MNNSITAAEARTLIDTLYAESAKRVNVLTNAPDSATKRPELVMQHVRLTVMLTGYPRDYLTGGPSRKGVAHGRHLWVPAIIDGVADPTQQMCSVCEALQPNPEYQQ